ncbi:MAG: GntR family transcriptional regulator [Syntrophobacteraceae bacterium]
MLNSQSPIPLYHQLADIILSKIRSGEYPPGSRIPSEHALAAAYGIGRPTARQAVDLLVRKRILMRRRGSGTFVRIQQEEVDLFSLAGTMSSFQKRGISVASRIVQKTRVKAISIDPENPFSGRNAFFFSRLSMVEDAPVLLEDIYMHPDIFIGFDEIDLTGRSLSQIVGERYYMRLASGRQNFRIISVDGRKAQELGVLPTTPVLLVKRFLNFPQADNAIYSELYCRTDQFVFSQTLGGFSDD